MEFKKDDFRYIIKLINDVNRVKTINWTSLYFFTFRGRELDTSPVLLWFMNIILYKLYNKNLWVEPDGFVKVRNDMEYPELFWAHIDEENYTLMGVR